MVWDFAASCNWVPGNEIFQIFLLELFVKSEYPVKLHVVQPLFESY